MGTEVKTRKRKVRALRESEEEEEHSNNGDSTSYNRRQSDRIHHKQHKAPFRMPSRDEIWKDIPSGPPKRIRSITPRKTVNNFTKVYNDYNYDDYDEDSTESETSSGTSDSEEETKHRIKGYHKRVKQLSSSSDEDEAKHTTLPGNCSTPERKGTNSENIVDTTEKMIPAADVIDSSVLNESTVAVENDATDSDSSGVISPSRINASSKRHSILESDTDGDEVTATNENDQRNLSSQPDEESDHDEISRSDRLKSKQARLFEEFKEVQSKKRKKADSSLSKTTDYDLSSTQNVCVL